MWLSLAYTLSPTTDEGALRILISDTTEVGSPTKGTDYYFSDADLTAILDLNGSNLWDSAADACRSLAARFAKEAIILGLGKQDIYIDKKKKSEYYLGLAKSFAVRSGSDVSEFVDNFSYSIDEAGNDQSEYIDDL